MARKRFVSPKFFSHGDLYDAEVESGLPLRLGFQSLWCQADRRGLFVWRPRELKLQCLPYDPCDFAEVLNALERGGFIASYMVDGRKYGFIPTLKDHQSFHKEERPDPTIPDPPHGLTARRHEAEAAPERTETASAQGQHSAGTVPAPPRPDPSSTIAVAVAVTTTTTNTAARTIGAPAPGQPLVALVVDPPDLSAHHERPPVPIGPAFIGQYTELADAALPYQRAALDALLAGAAMADVVIGSIYAIASGMHQVVSDRGEVAGIEHVLIALTEAAQKFFADKRPFDQALFRGCVRRVINRKPEPTTADQRASEEAIRRVAPSLRIADRSDDEQQEADRRRRASMRKFYLEAGRADKAQLYQEPVAEAVA